jgi:mannosyl-oligosaccharide alpha-1,2-mannosidase
MLESHIRADYASIGAMADSGYEYFLKEWLLTGRKEPALLEMCTSLRSLILIILIRCFYTDVASAEGVLNNLMYLSRERKLLYVTDTNKGTPSGFLERLSCFLPGLLALGYHTIPGLPERHIWAAEGLAQTCYLMYADQESGLGPDQIVFLPRPVGEDLWVSKLALWEAAGRKGAPPGTEDKAPILEKGHEKRDYEVYDPKQPLRPEVGRFSEASDHRYIN